MVYIVGVIVEEWFCSGLTVPVNDPNEKDKWQQHIYPVEMLQNQKVSQMQILWF